MLKCRPYKNIFQLGVDKYIIMWYNSYRKKKEVIKMRIEKNEYDELYPYTIHGDWGNKIYCDEEDLQELKKEIEKTLDKSH